MIGVARSLTGNAAHATAGGSASEPFAAVVIGSGFGGSVVASRLAAEGRGKVLLLERGMPYPPGSFARSPRELGSGFWDPGSSLYGLFELWSFKHSSAIVSSGLGGGSLIYANVLLERPDVRLAPAVEGRDPHWPLAEGELARRYREVKEVLGGEALPQEYRRSGSPAPAAVPKTEQFMRAAREAGFRDVEAAHLAITFAEDGRVAPGIPIEGENLHARERRTCTLSGSCDLGCNEGAKNTLDYNYLTRFRDAGGNIRTCCEVVELRRPAAGGSFEVRYVQHGPAREKVLARAQADGTITNDSRLLDKDDREGAVVQAPLVVLAAGALGSPRLLMQSRLGLRTTFSARLGEGFSSNGDMLLFARGCSEPDGRARELSPGRGPVITAYATGGAGGRDRLWLEDAGGPLLSEWGWQLPETALRALRGVIEGGLRRAGGGRRSARAADLLGGAPASAAMLPLLAMGMDRAGGRMSLDDPGMALDWSPAGSQAHFEAAERSAAAVAERLGGKLWPPAQFLRKRARGVTVHPLGGCRMGETSEEGVVDGNGEVFGCPGLFVADGSLLDGPVGPNPSLTIAALAGHVADVAASRL